MIEKEKKDTERDERERERKTLSTRKKLRTGQCPVDRQEGGEEGTASSPENYIERVVRRKG